MKDVFGHENPAAGNDQCYKGHAGKGGIQNHSVGDDYPYTVIGVQRYGDKSLADRGGVEVPQEWQVMDCRTGNKSQYFRTPIEAFIHISSLKLRNMMHG